MTTCVLDLAKEPDPAPLVPEVLLWLTEAGGPYFEWIFGGESVANVILGRWLERTSSEISLKRIRLLQSGVSRVGGFVAVAPEDLVVCRRADALALLKDADYLGGRKALLTRLELVRELFPPVAEDEYYLSKIGVSPSLRGQGYGRQLLDAFLDQGRAAGFRRFRLDVASDNRAAIGLYRSRGFEINSESASTDGKIRYAAMIKEEPR